MSDAPPAGADGAARRGWLDERIDLAGIRRTLLDREVPDRLTWWHTLGSATLTVFVFQVVTGVVLGTFYSAAPDHAYESILYLQREVTAGGLLRAMHRWGASAMVVLVLAHMIRVFSMGAYKYPREVNWILGVFLFFLVMGFGFTGYLLPWDQKAYWATQVGTSIAGTTPLIGGLLTKLLKGGSQLGVATLSRFYAFHVLWLPLLFGLVILVHVALVIRQGIAPSRRRSRKERHVAPRMRRTPAIIARRTRRRNAVAYDSGRTSSARTSSLPFSSSCCCCCSRWRSGRRSSHRPTRQTRRTCRSRSGTSCRSINF